MPPDPNRVQARLLEADRYYGWFVVVGCFALSLMTAGTMFSFSVFLGPVLETFDQSYANASLVFSVQSFVTFSGAAVLGFAVDRYGLGRLLVVAAVLITVGLVGASQSPSFAWVLLSYSVVAAAGMGITFVVAYTTTPRWFERRRALATGVAVSGWGVGIVAMPPFVEVLIARLGWQPTYLVLAGLFLVAIAVAMALLANRPQELGVDTGDEFETAPSVLDGGHPASVRRQLQKALEAVWTPLFALVFAALLLAFVPANAILVYLVDFTEAAGVSRQIGVIAVSIVGGMNVVAKFTAGWAADRIGTDWMMATCVVLMCVPTLLLVAVPTPTTVLVLSAVFGFGYGGIAALMSPLVANLFGTGDLSTLFGITCIGFAVAGVSVPYAVGQGLDTFGNYEIPFVVTAAVGLLSAVLFVGVRRARADV
ncbi:MFS transporter [Natrarchaeobaculum aegyptiacum]|uniref:MFS transporter n=1 Tax=Natrarchaeobaculum aegyptiacum TaxID=745377 RepID=A0A2Z2HQE6_9EURY|nr:MFS transporter [Natrarchaeobaculum aegyptiacum]ARS89370.1 MFS transporter [Natrarchaeobaculum aegyptiacum]